MKKIVSIITILILLIGTMPLSFALNEESLQIKEAVININSQGEVKVQPNVAYLNITVIEENSDSEVATNLAAKKMDLVYKDLIKVGIKKDNIETSYFNIDTVRDYRDEKSIMPAPIVGYRVTNSVEIEILNLSQISKVVDVVSKHKNININGLKFDLKDKQKVKNEAIKDAILKAKSQAQTVSEAFGGRIIGIKNVTVNTSYDNYYPTPYLSKNFDASMESNFNTPISSPELTVTANVNIEFLYSE